MSLPIGEFTLDKFIASEGFQVAGAGLLESVTDYSDVAGIVKLVTTPFTASKDIDPATIPGNTTEFSAKTSGTPTAVTTIDPPGRSTLYPEPAGGWTFTPSGGTYPQTVYGYRIDNATNFVGCQNIPPQIIEAAGDTVILGVIRTPIVQTPYQGN